jgi:hypothetical protein
LEAAIRAHGPGDSSGASADIPSGEFLAVVLPLSAGNFRKTPSPKLWLEEKSTAKPERQKATKGGNELVAI